MSHITGVATGLLGVYLRWAVHLMYPVKTNQLNHHMFMRKMMQHQPHLVKEIYQETQKSYTTKYSIFILLVVCLFVIMEHRIVVKTVRTIIRPVLDVVGKTKLLGVFEKQHI